MVVVEICLLSECGRLAKSERKRVDVDDDELMVLEMEMMIIGVRHGSRIVPGRIRRRAELLYAIHGCKVVKCVKP